MNTPTTAKTLSSSANEVQSDSGSGLPPGIGGYFLLDGDELATADPAVLVDVVDEDLADPSVSPKS